jgi:hypothetical protein
MEHLKAKTVGYGQRNIRMRCKECENEMEIHDTGYSWEEHHEDCELSNENSWIENICAGTECDSCGHIEDEEMFECECEEIREAYEQDRRDNMSQEERDYEDAEIAAAQQRIVEDELARKEAMKAYLGSFGELPEEVIKEVGFRPDGSANSNKVKNWKWRAKQALRKLQVTN